MWVHAVLTIWREVAIRCHRCCPGMSLYRWMVDTIEYNAKPQNRPTKVVPILNMLKLNNIFFTNLMINFKAHLIQNLGLYNFLYTIQLRIFVLVFKLICALSMQANCPPACPTPTPTILILVWELPYGITLICMTKNLRCRIDCRVMNWMIWKGVG